MIFLELRIYIEIDKRMNSKFGHVEINFIKKSGISQKYISLHHNSKIKAINTKPSKYKLIRVIFQNGLPTSLLKEQKIRIKHEN